MVDYTDYKEEGSRIVPLLGSIAIAFILGVKGCEDIYRRNLREVEQEVLQTSGNSKLDSIMEEKNGRKL